MSPRQPKNIEARSVITILKGRSHTVTVYSSRNGPQFDVESSDSAFRRSDLTLAALREEVPEVYEQYRTALAGDLWAGMDASAP